MKRALVATLIVPVALPALAADLPNPTLTPGVARSEVTAADLCPVAHTAKVRNVTVADKAAGYHSYGLSGNHTGYCAVDQGCEVDHLISLEIGGATIAPICGRSHILAQSGTPT